MNKKTFYKITDSKKKRFVALCVLAVSMLPLGASAVVLDCGLGTVTSTERGNYNNCIGGFDGNDAGLLPSLLNSGGNVTQNGTPQTVAAGVFDGITNWVLDAKYDIDTSMVDAGPNTLGFTISTTPGTDNTEGTWAITPAVTDAIVISLKTATAFSVYYFQAGVSTDDGSWNTLGVSENQNGRPQGLSHGSLLIFKDGGDQQELPEPSTLLLSALGLIGIGIYGRRRRQS